MSESSELSFPPIPQSSTPNNDDLSFEGEGIKSEETLQQEKSEAFTSQLISWVQRVKILYDHSHKQYRNAEKKLDAWNYVKNKVGYLGETQELADHWKIIRDRYTKAKRKIAANKPTKFQFISALSFLDPHIIDRSTWHGKDSKNQQTKSANLSKTKNPNFYQRLIQLVHENPCFYDTSNAHYRKYIYKCQIWNKIADELGFEGNHNDIYKQWKKLRDRYVRETRKLRLNGRSKISCKWGFLSDMEWMEPFIEEPRPLEDFEVIVEEQQLPKNVVDEEEAKPIFGNGRKTAEIKILKPVKRETKMPKLLPQVVSRAEQRLPSQSVSSSYSDFSEPPMVIYGHSNQPQTSIILTTTTATGSSNNIPLTLQPEVAYYIEESAINNPEIGEQFIIASDISHFEFHPGDDADHHETFEAIVDGRSGGGGGDNFPREFIISPSSLTPSTSSSSSSTATSSRNFVYAITKNTDLNNLPENIREAVEAQGKDVFKDKSILYVK